MAMVRQFRSEAIRRLYRQGAIVYLVLSLLALFLSGLLPPLAPATAEPVPPWQRLASWFFFLVISFFIVWRGFQRLTFLLSLFSLSQGISYLISAAGLRLSPGLEGPLPAEWRDTAAWQELLQAELASDSPFLRRMPIASDQPVDIFQALRSWPWVGDMLPEAGLLVRPAVIFVICGALMALVTLVLWRAARVRPTY